ncbi:MAG: hypothetical protein E6K50_02920 [Gammaproteobacteria bacterium]|nr:MAG: hypothetical protein E6K50_02920 [Gammaproteobacteria bacterium]
MQPLAASHVDDVGIRRRHDDRTDRLRRLLIEDGPPGATGVVGFPDPAVGRTHIEDVRLRGYPGQGAGAPAAERPDHAPGEIAVEAGRLLLREAGAHNQRQADEAQRRHEQ